MKKDLHKTSYWSVSNIVMLLLLVLLCYWPLSSGIFSAKNDNITPFLPIRFHISEALRSGHLPLWTPYIYLGFPLHGDMQGGAWNPVVWLLSVFGRYNLTSLHAEVLIYIFLSGLGMLRLLGAFRFSKTQCFTGAAAYTMCGYISDVGGSNLPFLAAAAYIPFVFAYYYHLLTSPNYQYAIKTALSLSLLFVSAYPSFFICTLYVLLAALLSFLTKARIDKRSLWIRALFITQALAALLFLAVSAPAIISYTSILPFYQRGAGIDLAGALQNNFDPSCIVSFIFPSVPIKNPASYSTDLISRNGYFNILLLLFACLLSFSKKTFRDWFTITGIAFFFLFSLGNLVPLRAWSYKLLPLMDTFRHPANARLFVIIGAIILAVTVYNKFIEGHIKPKQVLRMAVLLLAFSLIALTIGLREVNLVSKLTLALSGGNDNRTALKFFLQTLTFNDHLVLNALAQIVSLSLFILLIRAGKFSFLPPLIIINSFLMVQFTIPYTLVSKVSPGIINEALNKIPGGYPIPGKTNSIGKNSSGLPAQRLLVTSQFYNKMIAAPALVVSPTFMNTMREVYRDPLKKEKVFSQPYAYMEDANAFFELTKIWNNGFYFTTITADTTLFYLQQVYLPGWKCFIDDKLATINPHGPGFISSHVPPGKHRVHFIYQPGGVVPAVLVSLLTLLAGIGLFYKKA